jgi:hypothetical protein
MVRPKAARLIPIIILLLGNAALLLGFGEKEADTKPAAPKQAPPLYRDRRAGANPERRNSPAAAEALERIRASGRVRLVGNSQRMSLVITGEKGEWYIDPKDQDKLMDLQQRTVTVEGGLYIQDISLLGGKYTGKRFVLRDITVISSE